MRPEEQRELDGLRARAYGPDADIDGDPDALRRLRELEGRPAPAAVAVPERPAVEEPVYEGEDAALEPPTVDEPPPPLPPASRSRQPRLMAVIAVAAVIAVVVVLVGAFVVLRPTGTDSLDPAAKQVARLSADPDYTVPTSFRNVLDEAIAANQASSLTAFREFHGLRAIMGTGPAFGSADGEACLFVYPSNAVSTPTSTAFPQPLWTGCGAGSFPAAAQFDVSSELPTVTRAAFPGGVALQFVYDAARDQVVVFAAGGHVRAGR